MPTIARRLAGLVAACLLAGALPSAARAQARAPEDTAAFRWLANAKNTVLWDTTAIPLTWLNSLANGYLHPRRDTMTQRWRGGVIFNPLFGGQQSIGFEIGGGYYLPRNAKPPPQTAELRMSVRWGVTGSRDGTIKFIAPQLWKDWRLLAMVRAERLMRTPYFGVNNQARVEDSLKDRYGIEYYRYALTRTTVFGSLMRHIVGPLWVQGALQRRWYRTNALQDQVSLFAEDVAAGRLQDTTVYRGTEERLGLVVDTRNFWDAPESGLFVEAMVAAGQLRNISNSTEQPYTRYLLGAREFVRISRRTTIALRQQAVLASDTLPFFLAYEQLTTGLPDDGVVGPRGIRLHGSANQLSSNQQFVSFEVRHKLINFREDPVVPLRLWATAFGDYGTLFEPATQPGTHKYQYALGVGARLQLHKASMIGFDVGGTEQGGNIVVVTYFAF